MRNAEVLRGLRKAAGTEAIQQWGSGISEYAETEKVLRPDLHGERAAQDSLSQLESQQDEGKSGNEAGLRNMRHDGPEACTPQRSRSNEQLTLELGDIVRLLPPSLALAELHGDRSSAQALRLLQQAIRKEGGVRDPSIPLEAVWASLGEEAKGRLALDFDASRWKLVVPFPLATGVKSRVGRLRGYGNAIVAPVAEAWIGVCLEEFVLS